MDTNYLMRHAKAILFSGGLDSTCAAVLNPSHALLRVGTGSKYDGIESTHAGRVAEALERDLFKIDGVLDLGRYEQDDALVPARNALVALVAAQHANELSLVSVAGDGTHATDKDVRFADIMSELLAKLFGEGSLVLPYRKFSKLELLEDALVADRERMLRALPYVWSCYGNGYSHCGHCKACIRLHGALAWAKIPTAHWPVFAVNPFTLPLSLIEAVYQERGHEAQEALRVYQQNHRSRL